MRKLLVVIIILIGFTIGINLSRDQKGFRTYQEVLTELINDAPMKTYRDSFYGYSIRYPEFFSQEITDKGFVRLGYWDNERFVIECSVLKAPDLSPVKIKMKELATQLHAEKQELLRDSFILSGPHYENGKRIEGYPLLRQIRTQPKIMVFVYTFLSGIMPLLSYTHFPPNRPMGSIIKNIRHKALNVYCFYAGCNIFRKRDVFL